MIQTKDPRKIIDIYLQMGTAMGGTSWWIGPQVGRERRGEGGGERCNSKDELILLDGGEEWWAQPAHRSRRIF